MTIDPVFEVLRNGEWVRIYEDGKVEFVKADGALSGRDRIVINRLRQMVLDGIKAHNAVNFEKAG